MIAFLLLVSHIFLKLNAQENKQVKTEIITQEIELCSWEYKNLQDSLWRSCQAPSLIQENLIKEGLLPQPYLADNEKKIQWVSNQDWLYQTTFQVQQKPQASQPLFLNFEGLDTYCSIYLNGELLGQTNNMFRSYDFNISSAVRIGSNRLVLHFHSPIKQAYPQYLSNGFNYPADNDHAKEHLSPFTRKAPYHYGWDWGMRLLTMGIYKPVRLIQYNQVAIRSLQLQSEVSWQGKRAEKAIISIKPELERFADTKLYYSLKLRDPKGKVQTFPRQALQNDEISFSIKDPKLWWVKEWGKPNLYEVELSLWNEKGEQLAKKNETFGIRELQFVNEADELGRSFYFRLNKEPLFIKGANYVPSEQILTQRTKEDFEQLFRDIDFANLNMIRVWGGGVYEDEYFYDLADREGVLVWQDFMFACTPYPSDEAFLNNVKQEAIHQVKRLRNHTCLALWCGNNEIKEAIKYWGWQRKFNKEDYETMKNSYRPLFEETLADVVGQYAPKQSYIHGSPMEANWGRPKSFTFGDSHYWGLWYGREDFSTFDDKPLRFVSEFGFQAFPLMKTIEAFAGEKDYDLESEVMRSHQKASTGNSLIKKYMERSYPVPESFDNFVYANNVLQKEGMEYVMRTLRRQRPVCMGALYWQLNDSWPAISWSGIDYFGNYKGLHYASREAFAPLNLSYLADKKQGCLDIYLNNDLLQAQEGLQLRYYYMDFYGKVREEKVLQLKATANSSEQVLSIAIAGKLNPSNMLVLELQQDGVIKDRICYYGKKTKELKLPKAQLKSRILSSSDGEIRLALKSKTLVKNLYIDVPIQGAYISNNFFDLLPNEEIELIIRSPKIKKKGHYPLSFRSMNELCQ